jgi:integrase
VRIPKLRVKEYPHSPTARYVIEGLRVGGKRKRLFFRTRAEALLELARIKTKRTREGADALAIPDSLRIMARDCAALLAPHAATIAEATRFYLEHRKALASSKSATALIAEYLDSKARAGLSAVHLSDLRYRFGRFNQAFGARSVRGLITEEIESWLHGLELGPRSFNNFRGRLVSLFSYGQKRHYLDSNPAAAIEPVKQRCLPPEIFQPHELARVLGAADPALVPALAIGAFTGLRTAELLRLCWSDVDLVGGYVHVAAAHAKSARRRLIPIPDNLRAWLAPYAGAKRVGAVCSLRPQYYHFGCARAAREAGLSRWPQNGLRHSYASYHLAYHQNAPELSLHMGHTSPRQLFEAYREVVTKEAAAQYWAITPPQTPDNVVALPAPPHREKSA